MDSVPIVRLFFLTISDRLFQKSTCYSDFGPEILDDVVQSFVKFYFGLPA